VARAIAEGRLNPVTMETFDKFSRTISPIEFIDTSALNVINQYGSQEILTQESSITICSSQESKDATVGKCSLLLSEKYVKSKPLLSYAIVYSLLKGFTSFPYFS
jgi:hypothetical protein